VVGIRFVGCDYVDGLPHRIEGSYHMQYPASYLPKQKDARMRMVVRIFLNLIGFVQDLDDLVPANPALDHPDQNVLLPDDPPLG